MDRNRELFVCAIKETEYRLIVVTHIPARRYTHARSRVEYKEKYVHLVLLLLLKSSLC